MSNKEKKEIASGDSENVVQTSPEPFHNQPDMTWGMPYSSGLGSSDLTIEVGYSAAHSTDELAKWSQEVDRELSKRESSKKKEGKATQSTPKFFGSPLTETPVKTEGDKTNSAQNTPSELGIQKTGSLTGPS